MQFFIIPDIQATASIRLNHINLTQLTWDDPILSKNERQWTTTLLSWCVKCRAWVQSTLHHSIIHTYLFIANTKQLNHNWLRKYLLSVLTHNDWQRFHNVKGLTAPTFIYRHLQGNRNSSGLQFEMAYWPALAVGSVAQSAAADPFTGRMDFGLAVAARQTHLCPSQPYYGLHPAKFSGNDSLILVVSTARYRLLLIYLSRRDGRPSWPEHHECK